MNPMPELTPVLKQLRLSGILETLMQRQRDAMEAKMPYVEFLATVLQDEAQRREHKRYQLRLRRRRLTASAGSAPSFSSSLRPSLRGGPTVPSSFGRHRLPATS